MKYNTRHPCSYLERYWVYSTRLRGYVFQKAVTVVCEDESPSIKNAHAITGKMHKFW